MLIFSLRDIGIVLASCFALWVAKTLYEFHKLAKGVDYIPGTWTLIHGLVIPRLLPAIPGFNRAFDWPWRLKYSGKHRLLITSIMVILQ